VFLLLLLLPSAESIPAWKNATLFSLCGAIRVFASAKVTNEKLSRFSPFIPIHSFGQTAAVSGSLLYST